MEMARFKTQRGALKKGIINIYVNIYWYLTELLALEYVLWL